MTQPVDSNRSLDKPKGARVPKLSQSTIQNQPSAYELGTSQMMLPPQNNHESVRLEGSAAPYEDQDDDAATNAHQMLEQPHIMPLIGGSDLNPDDHANQYSTPGADGHRKKESSCSPPIMNNRFDD